MKVDRNLSAGKCNTVPASVISLNIALILPADSPENLADDANCPYCSLSTPILAPVLRAKVSKNSNSELTFCNVPNTALKVALALSNSIPILGIAEIAPTTLRTILCPISNWNKRVNKC